MTRKFVYILLICAFFAFSNQSSLPHIRFNQGKVNLRNLEATKVSGEKLDFSADFSTNNAVLVDLGAEYLSKAGLERDTKTHMLLFLFTNTSGFCSDCQEFSAYTCSDAIECSPDSNKAQKMVSPYYTVRQGSPITHKLNIGNSWELKTSALYYSKNDRELSKIFTSNSARREYAQDNSYGFIGLGAGGEAAKNFQSKTGPVFSIKINSTGNGSLIFGKDESLYNKSQESTVLTADTNWGMKTSKMTFGPSISISTYSSNLIFDLQFPGIGIPYSYYVAGPNIFSQLRNKYNLTHNGSFGDSYPYIYSGKLENLPPLSFGLADGKKLELPPSAYTRALGNDTYQILLGYVGKVFNGTEHLNHTVLGWPVLSQFYSIFEHAQGSEPTITLHKIVSMQVDPAVDPIDDGEPKDKSISVHVLLGVLGFLFLACIGMMIFKKRAAAKLQGELSEGLKYNERIE